MGTEIIKSFGVLQSELEQAKSSLKGVDENIKRLIGRDPSEIIPRPGIKRGPATEENNRGRQRVQPLNRNRPFSHENDEPPNKRRPGSVFKRLSERPVHFEEELQHPQKQMISKVIVTPREVPSRQEALAAQRTDEKSKARNRRMFGALLGTLQKFQQEETKLKSKEQKRAQVEKKIEEHEIREKAEIKKERQELFFNRKKKQAEIKMIELKMTRMREYSAWEERQKPRINFILTKTKPQISYLPRKLNDANKILLEACKSDVERMIEKRRQEVNTELQHIEERMKKNFEPKKSKDIIQEDEAPEENDEMEIKDELAGNGDIHVNDSIVENSNFSETGGISEVYNTSGDTEDNIKNENVVEPTITNEDVQSPIYNAVEPNEKSENLSRLETNQINDTEISPDEIQLPASEGQEEIAYNEQSCVAGGASD